MNVSNWPTGAGDVTKPASDRLPTVTNDRQSEHVIAKPHRPLLKSSSGRAIRAEGLEGSRNRPAASAYRKEAISATALSRFAARNQCLKPKRGCNRPPY